MSTRRKARELTLKALYAYEITKAQPEQIAEDIIAVSLIKPQAKEFSHKLFFKTIESMKELDGHIKSHAKSWDFSRIATVEKNILRMGICEFLYFDDIHTTIIIDEAIELAKRYGDKDAKSFVNAVLDSVLKTIQKK